MRLLKSFKYAWQGIKYCCTNEKNFRIQLLVAAITFISAFIFKIKFNEWVTVLFCSALVLTLEMVNTTIEKLSNMITESFHPVIKQIKDIAAGAVWLASMVSFIIGCIIFIPKIEMAIKNFTL